MKVFLYLIGLYFFFTGLIQAGGPWDNQYCNIKTTTIKTIDKNGNIVDEKIEEKIVCDDGVKDFLHGMGIAENCQFFTWMMPLGQTVVEQRSIACKRLDGGYEIVEGYHYIK